MNFNALPRYYHEYVFRRRKAETRQRQQLVAGNDKSKFKHELFWAGLGGMLLVNAVGAGVFWVLAGIFGQSTASTVLKTLVTLGAVPALMVVSRSFGQEVGLGMFAGLVATLITIWFWLG
ncbi:MAG: hypothetical protein OXB99_16845 [Acidimicrobiaceae bacterium]|nr:hypothetical protein [Acidimicrobiaceae bacterium]